MNRSRFHIADCISLLSIILILCSAAVQGQSASADRRTSDQLITGLLKLPAPAPPAGIPGEQLPQTTPITHPSSPFPLMTLHWMF